MSVQVITVQTSFELRSAIMDLSDGTGGVIKVENAEEIYELSMFRAGTDAGHIQIVAADPGNPPVFAQVKLIEGQNMTFSGLTFDSSQSAIQGKDLDLIRGSDITIQDSTFTGTATGFYTGLNPDVEMGKAMGVVRDSTGIVFANNEVAQYGQGLAVIDSVGTEVTGNVFSKMVGDGLRMAGVQGTLVDGNEFKGFYGSTQDVNHSDMLQVWSANYNKLNTENLTISNNIFNSSGGVATQTIFIKNETFPDTGQVFKDIVIENNTIYNGHLHGVAVYHTDGLAVKNNTLLWNPDAAMQSTPTSKPVSMVPEIHLDSVHNATVSGNITGGIHAPGVDVGDNVTVDFTNAAEVNFVGEHFTNAVGGVLELRDMMLVETSEWKGKFGSTATKERPDEVTAVIRQQEDSSFFGRVIFDASESWGPTGSLDASATQYVWTFPDGTTATGKTVTHVFDTAGRHDVTLSIVSPHGSDSITRSAVIEPDILLDLRFDHGLTDSSNYYADLSHVRTTPEDRPASALEAFHLNGQNDLIVSRQEDQLNMLPTFTLSLSLRREEGGDAGVFLHKHKSLSGTITEDGAFRFAVKTSDGSFIAKTDPGLVSDTDWHDLIVTFSEGHGGLKLYVDGALEAQVEATGIMVGSPRHDLVIGNTWIESMQGWVDDFTMKRSVFDPATALEEAAEPEPEPAPTPPVVSPFEQAALLRFDFENGVADTSGKSSSLRVIESAQENPSDGVFTLDGESKIIVGRENAHLLNLDSFSLGLSLARSEGGDSGNFAHVHHAFGARVTEEGGLQVTLVTTDGRFEATTEAGLIEENAWHRVVMTYDGTAEGAGLQIYIDGTLEAQVDATGTMASSGTHHMVIGNTWNDSMQGWVDNIALDQTAMDAVDIANDYIAMLPPSEEQGAAPDAPETVPVAPLDDLAVGEMSVFAASLQPDASVATSASAFQSDMMVMCMTSDQNLGQTHLMHGDLMPQI